MIHSEDLIKGQQLKVNLDNVRDRLPKKLLEELIIDPYGTLIGYKMVDGNNFGLVLKFKSGATSWFFPSELIEVTEKPVESEG